MTDEPRRPITISAESWTGTLPEPLHVYAPGGPKGPPVDLAAQQDAMITALFCLCGLVLYLLWWVMLAYHSPWQPSPETGHTTWLPMLAGRGGTVAIHVRPVEAVVALVLFASGPAGAVVHLGVQLWRRWRRR